MSNLPLIHRWLNSDHLRETWGRKHTSQEEVEEHFGRYITGKDPVELHLFLYGDRPVGYVQKWSLRDYPAYCEHVSLPEGSVGLDLFIGEAEFLHHGLGPAILRRFVRQHVFDNGAASTCIVDPDIDNRAAIHAFEKAGFRYLATVLLQDGENPHHVMIMRQRDFDSAQSD